MKVLIQLRSSETARSASVRATAAPSLSRGLELVVGAGLIVDAQYPPVQVPGVRSVTGAPVRGVGQPVTFSHEPARSTFHVRGTTPDEALPPAVAQSTTSHPFVVGVFADLAARGLPARGEAAGRG